MIAGALTKNFGVLAADSSMYDTSLGRVTFESPKIARTSGNTVFTFIGTQLYLTNIDLKKLTLPFDSMVMYLKDFLKQEEPKVRDMMKEAIRDKDDQKPHFCMLVLGLYKGLPTVAQFSSFKNFNPLYLQAKEKPIVFTTLYYGKNDNVKNVFSESTKYMYKKSRRYSSFTPGLMGEILTRGIYKKADLEEKLTDKKKYAGGIVNSAYIDKNGIVNSLSVCPIVN